MHILGIQKNTHENIMTVNNTCRQQTECTTARSRGKQTIMYMYLPHRLPQPPSMPHSANGICQHAAN
jgi:hypothetical protein